ncbi:transmembrane protein 198-like [Anneissia japonica]|uniref:transmembrane protein 198-like n=1 Tax=Anneissia japonica TaxID=1529436 RepID=UPI00142551CF|nr:transmembrane protein 198-like [Anneissia japonica]XP_033106244.1 transmembrane protein 198-like [Anneissia japonica]XP_033106245.1 transmembrane protein 198-like [Anneissia japonica]XP_033106246.1 transmembrane protein 198-like [Anneissia japonica]XP_033106247.1 transmembrane protein 198-like [Anneissia japonica]
MAGVTELITVLREDLPTTTLQPSLVNQCETIQYAFDIPMSIICCLLLIFGIIFSFFGYRCFKAVMFLVGFMFGAVVVLIICEEEDLLSTGANAGIAVGIGLLFGLITMLVQYIGLFMTGFQLGLLIGVSTLIILEQFYHPTTFWFPVGITFGCGVVCALLTLQWQKSMVILSTSITGGSTVVVCLDYFMEMFIMVKYVYDRMRANESISVCWYSWLILAVWPIVAVVGIIVQIRVTGKDYDHKEVAKPRTRPATKRMELYKIRQQESRNMKQQRYRYLHQIRRYNGDIVTPSYLQSVHDAMSPDLPEIMGTYTNVPPSPPPKGLTDLPPLPDNFSDTTTDDNNRFSAGQYFDDPRQSEGHFSFHEQNRNSAHSKKFEDSHRSRQSPRSSHSQRNSFLEEFTYVDENRDSVGQYSYVDDSTLPMPV